MTYRFVAPESGNEEAIQKEVDRAFDFLFDMTLAAELEQKSKQVGKQNKVFSTSKSTVDNSAQLGIS
jgi:hypothetical protein